MLDAKVAEALGTGDFRRAKGLALTSEHWQMIAAAEQRINQAVTGRTDADLRAELGVNGLRAQTRRVANVLIFKKFIWFSFVLR